MATNFPTSLDNLSNPAGSDPVNNPSHASQHANLNDAVEKLEEKVGVNNSAVTTSLDYRVRQLELNPVTSTANKIEQVVVNNTGSTLLEGQVVYASGSIGASGKLRVSLSSNAAESTSTKTFGILAEDIINGGEGLVVTEGIVEGINTVGANDGDPVWLGVNGNKIFGLVNKPSAPAHLVFLGIVVRGGQANTGSIFVKIQNGFELEELHNVQITSPATGEVLVYDATTSLWKNSNTIASKTYVDNAITSLANTADITYVPVADVGNPDGVASLDSTGKVPDTQIPAGIARDSEVSSSISTAINNLINSAPGTLDTLGEIATQLAADESAVGALTTVVNGKVSKAGGDVITPSSASTKGLIIKGAASQTANLLEFQDSSGTVVGKYNSSYQMTVGSLQATIGDVQARYGIYGGGTGYLGALSIVSWAANVPTAVLRGYASQTANLTEWQNSAGTVLAKIGASGLITASNGLLSSNGLTGISTAGELATGFTYVKLGTASDFAMASSVNFGALVSIGSGGNASFVPLAIRGSASQTANLQQWQNSSGTVLSSFSSNGRLAINTTEDAGGRALYVVQPNGGYGSVFAGVGTIPNVTIYAASGGVGLLVQGAASQTANLQEWQNSAGTVLAKINASGSLNFSQPSAISEPIIDISIPAFHVHPGVLTRSGTAWITALNPTGLDSYWQGRFYSRDTATVALWVKGKASQTADLQQWQNSAGTVLAKVDSTGAIFTPTAAPGTNTTQVATTAFVIDQIDASTQPGALYQTTAPTSPEIGQIWIDSDENVTTFDSNIIRRKAITATAGQTVFTADLPFIDGFEQIFMNGLLLVKTTDYTTSNSNTVTLTSAAAASDIIEIVSVTGANSVNTYTQAEVDALLAANTSVAPLSISANTTLVAKKRYFVTSASALTLTLPASPALNDEIQLVDASGNASTYNITVARNGNKINGGTGNLIIDNNGGWYTLLYTGATYGWKVG